ncbi:MAG TPA: CHAT domain-containing protein [Candidatus Scatomorpha stercorigallinarum]|nr:CHAT domain-containing protein [Candidatus Scatomorpha stercorigallinarum]
MRKLGWMLLSTLLFLCTPVLAQGQTRALLVACTEFVTQPNLGNSISGNLHMIGSAFLGSGVRAGSLSIEDGTIGTVEALSASIQDAFSMASEDDLSILYLCTHGILSSSDDEQVYLLLGDGQNETPLNADDLYTLLRDIQGEKLLILDACYSGALIGRGVPEQGLLPGTRAMPSACASAFLADPSIHVLTSASGYESSWYYDSEGLANGAVSYFASALSSGLGLYGTLEADANADGAVSLMELHRYLSVAVPSSSSQLLSVRPENLYLPVSTGPTLEKPLTGFSYGSSLLLADAPTLDFAFTVTQDTAIQYRLVEFADGNWNWAEATTFLDEGDDGNGTLYPGRKTRALTLPNLSEGDSGYLMLQVFSLSSTELILCSERLIAVQPITDDVRLDIRCSGVLAQPGVCELPIDVRLNVPAEITVSVFDGEGDLVRRIASSQLTRPAPGGITHLYWDGRDASGAAVAPGHYTVAVEAVVGSSRRKASADITIGG